MSDSTKRTVRTALQVLLGLCLVVPVIVQATGLSVEETPWLGLIVAAAAAIAKAMQNGTVDDILAPVGLDRGQGEHEAP